MRSYREPPICEVVGERLRLARRGMNLTQEQLAKRVGTSNQQILKYEKGIDQLSISRLVQIAKALHTPISFFFEDLYLAEEAVVSEATTGPHLLMQAYGALTQTNRALLLSIARVLVEAAKISSNKEGGKVPLTHKDRPAEGSRSPQMEMLFP
jgi:transcriptional regulator with XRE-family HTH domain